MAGLVTTSMRYVPNVPGIEAAGKLAGMVGQQLVGEEILQAAQAIAPVATGAYRDSLYKSTDADDVYVGSDIRYAGYLEFGTSDTPVFATLRRASEMAEI